MSDIAFRMGADPSGLQSGLQAAQAALRAAATRMQSAFKPVQSAIDQSTSGLQRFQGVIGGLSLAAFAASIRTSIQQIDSLNDAADRTGASIEELSSLQNTLAPYGATLEQITAATGRLVKAMSNADDETKGAGEAFALLGVKTRDASGNLRPAQDVLVEVARALEQYKDGSAKTALAMAIFGRQGAELLPMLKDLATAQREAATITTEQAAAAEKAEQALNRLGHEMTVMRQEAANALIPALNELLAKMRSIATISGSPAKWWRYMFGDASDINAEVARIEADIKRLQGVVDKGGNSVGPNSANPGLGTGLLSQWFGDGNSARDALMQLQRDLQEARAVQAAQRRLGVSTAQAPRSGRAMLYDDAGYGPAPDRPDAPSPSGDGGAAAKALANRQRDAIQGMELQLAKERELTEAEQMRMRITTGAYRDFSTSAKARLMQLAEELDRQKLLERASKQAGDEEAEDYRAMQALREQAIRDMKRENEELERTADRYKDLIDPTRKYTRQLEEIRNLVARGKLSKEQGLSAEFEVENARQDDLDKLVKPETPTWLGTLEGGFRRLFDSIREGSISARGVMQGAFGMMADVATNALSKISAEWLTNMLIGKVTALKSAFTDISASAARAGAAAFASTAAIPIVGPVMAPAAGAAAYAGAMSYASGLAVASASGGFDIPGNLNPLTQLHAKEMVLPADIAEPAREMFRGGGRGGPTAVHFHSPDAKGIERLFVDNPRALAKGLQKLARNGIRG